MNPLARRLWITSFAAAILFVSGVAAQQAQRDPRQYQQTLENPDRVAALQIDRVVAALGVTPGMRVADLGAGTGLFTLPLAKAVGPTGKVYGIDVDAGLLAIVSEKATAAGATHIQPIVAGDTDPRLPEPVDLLFICDTMHHLPNQAAYVKQFGKLLRPGGRVAIIDFSEGKWPSGHESFAITPAQVDAWMQAAGFKRSATHTFLATNFFHVYERAAGQVVKKEVPGITNFSRVDATFACGGATTPAAVQALKADGFTSIVNLRAADEPGANVEAEKEAARTAGVLYFHLPFKGSADAAVVDQFLDVVGDPKNQPVFIHCATANRAGAFWVIKRVRLDGWPVEKALTEAEAIGLTNPTLRQFALDYLSREKKSDRQLGHP